MNRPVPSNMTTQNAAERRIHVWHGALVKLATDGRYLNNQSNSLLNASFRFAAKLHNLITRIAAVSDAVSHQLKLSLAQFKNIDSSAGLARIQFYGMLIKDKVANT